MKRSAILPLLGYAGYPLAIVGGVLVFTSSSMLALNMISDNMAQVATPAASARTFNVPAVQQIGSLPSSAPASAVSEPQPVPLPETSVVDVPPPQQTIAVAAVPAEANSITEIAAPEAPADLGMGRIGSQAVNVRAAPSKDGPRLGVLNAGATIRIGEDVGGWIHVYYEGGDGWVYKSYIAGYAG